MNWLWSQFQDFALGVAVISFGFGAIGLGRMLYEDPPRLKRESGAARPIGAFGC